MVRLCDHSWRRIREGHDGPLAGKSFKKNRDENCVNKKNYKSELLGSHSRKGSKLHANADSKGI